VGTIELPGNVYDAVNVPENVRDEVLRRELAVSLYRERLLSFGKARELADCSHREFHTLLGERGVESLHRRGTRRGRRLRPWMGSSSPILRPS